MKFVRKIFFFYFYYKQPAKSFAVVRRPLQRVVVYHEGEERKKKTGKDAPSLGTGLLFFAASFFHPHTLKLNFLLSIRKIYMSCRRSLVTARQEMESELGIKMCYTQNERNEMEDFHLISV